MILTIKEILNSFDNEIPKLFKSVFGNIDPETELIRKQVPDRLIRFDDGEKAMVGVISDLRKDRDDEVVLPEGMDDSNYSGIVLWQHDYWREDVPHARSIWRKKNPTSTPYEVLAKTLYITELSELGGNVYLYRKAEHPLGQSIGFSSKERVRKGDTGYTDIYKAWVQRCKAMLKDKGIKATPDEFSEPYCFYTRWELWEYSDVFIGSNPDALQVAVSKGIISDDEARELVRFTQEDKPADAEILSLLKRIEAMEDEISKLKQANNKIPQTEMLAEMWNAKSLDDLWASTE